MCSSDLNGFHRVGKVHALSIGKILLLRERRKIQSAEENWQDQGATQKLHMFPPLRREFNSFDLFGPQEVATGRT